MNSPGSTPPPADGPPGAPASLPASNRGESNAGRDAGAPSSMDSALPTGKILRRLFLTLFLRGRSSRGLQKDKVRIGPGQPVLEMFQDLQFLACECGFKTVREPNEELVLITRRRAGNNPNRAAGMNERVVRPPNFHE